MDGQDLSFQLEEIGLLDLELEPGYDNLTSLAADLLTVPMALISVMHSEKKRLFFKSFHGLEEPWRSSREIPLDQSFCQHVQEAEQPLVVTDASKDDRVCDLDAVSDLGVMAYLGVPIRGPDGGTIGSFCVIDAKPRDWSDRDLDHVSKLASAANDQILLRAALRARDEQFEALEREMEARKKAEAELVRLATTDPLTGTMNRRALTERAAAEMVRSARYGHKLAVAIIDLDHFKKVNDEHGHPVGDEVLKAVSERLRSTIRDKIDILARIGGEEFCVLLPQTDAKTAVEAAERIRKKLADKPMTDGISVTGSVGVALRQENDETFHDILERADDALYAAKDAGRNRVRLHDGSDVTVPDAVSTAQEGDASAARQAGRG